MVVEYTHLNQILGAQTSPELRELPGLKVLLMGCVPFLFYVKMEVSRYDRPHFPLSIVGKLILVL